MTNVLAFEGVGRSFGSGHTAVSALRDVDLRVQAGELMLVMGPSGSGKSTLLLLAGVLDRPTAGTVSIKGQSTSDMSASVRAAIRRRRVGYVFQQYNLLPQLTAVENVALPMELDGVAATEARRAGHEALDAMGLAGLAMKFPDSLSGGEQQRVAIARGLVGSRELLLADEPTGALDSAAAAVVMEILRRRCEEGAAVVVVSHNEAHARYADTTVQLHDGAVVGTGADAFAAQ